MSHVKYPDPATIQIWPGGNDQVPGSGTRPNSLPVPSLVFYNVICKYTLLVLEMCNIKIEDELETLIKSQV